MRFNTGDKVWIKTIKELESVPKAVKTNNGISLPDGYWNSFMDQFSGMYATVTGRSDDHDPTEWYDLDIVKDYYFSSSMLKDHTLTALNEPRVFSAGLI